MDNNNMKKNQYGQNQQNENQKKQGQSGQERQERERNEKRNYNPGRTEERSQSEKYGKSEQSRNGLDKDLE